MIRWLTRIEEFKNLPRFLQWPRELNNLGEKHKNETGCRLSQAPEYTRLKLTTKSSPSSDWQMPDSLHLHPNKCSLPFQSVPENEADELNHITNET